MKLVLQDGKLRQVLSPSNPVEVATAKIVKGLEADGEGKLVPRGNYGTPGVSVVDESARIEITSPSEFNVHKH